MMDEKTKQVFDELVQEVNFLETRFKDALEVIYSRLEWLQEKGNGVFVAKREPTSSRRITR